MLKIALDAGHGLYTAGKRCLYTIDANETREWILNSRDMTKLHKLLEGYENVEVRRMDDVTGAIDIPLFERVRKANEWGADLYLSNHKNAGINGGSGGGVVVIKSTNASPESTRLQSILYNHLIATTGLRGNRANPMPALKLYVLYNTKMPALLVEGGFMDSQVDTPIILTDAYSDKIVQGYLNFLVEQYNLVKKPEPIVDTVLPDNQYFRVVVGSYHSRNSALSVQANLKEAGFDSFLTVYTKEG